MRYLKSTLAIMLAVLMVLSLVACGGDTPENSKDNSKTPQFEETTAQFSQCDVTVVGAEQIIDYDDKDALRLWIDIKNTSDESVYVSWLFDVFVSQDGYELVETSTGVDYTVDEERFRYSDIRPGVSIRTTFETAMKPDGGTIKVDIKDGDDESNVLSVELDPKNLPGAPKKAFEIEPIESPEWLKDYNAKGEYEAFGDVYEVSIDKFELTEGYSDKMIRVYFSFKNTSDETTSFHMNMTPVIYQDGISLETGYPTEEVEEDANWSKEIASGESISLACCYNLISDSPVEVDLTDMSGGGVGAVYEIK